VIERYFEEDELDCDHDKGLDEEGGVKACAWIVEHSVANIHYLAVCSSFNYRLRDRRVEDIPQQTRN
jgi:hypothetical protein